MTVIHKSPVRITIEGKWATSPEEALAFATQQATEQIGNARLVEASILTTLGVGNSWDIEATFEQKSPS